MVPYLNLLDSVPRAILSAVIKISIWVIPVLFLVKYVEKRNPSSYLGLRHHLKSGLKWAGWITLALIFYFVIINLVILKKEMDFNIGFNELLNTVLLVGFIEEIVFRGFLLRKLMETYRFWTANILTSLLFVSIHFPIWFYKDLFEFPYIFGSILTAFVLGMLFGFVYKKSNSLWSVIIIHSLYNLFVSLFY